MKMRTSFLIFLSSLIILGCGSNHLTLRDLDGNTYKTKEINGLTWMMENLRVSKDKDGQSIQVYYPNEDPKLQATYGLFYDYETACKVCPEGWRLPNNEDWMQLISSFEQNDAALFKEEGFWENDKASNKSGFSIRPAGYGNSGEFDNNFGQKTLFWSKTKENEHDVWTFIAETGLDSIRWASQHPTYGFSIRCVKEE